MNPVVLILLFFSLGTSPASAQGEEAPTYRSLTFTSDQAEEAIYQNSPTAKIEAKKRAIEQTGGAAETSTPATGTGLHRLTITPDENVKRAEGQEKSAPEKKESKVDSDEAPPPMVKGPTPITPARKLKHWNAVNDLYGVVGGTPEQIKATLSPFEGAPGRVPPLGLIQMATLYESLGDMKLSARYYYAAQLRARFDSARFGAKGETARKNVQRFAQDLTPRIGPWAAQSSARLTDVLNDVRAWDLVTPYDYHPGFGMMAADPPEQKDDRAINDEPERSTAGDSKTPPSESEWPDVLDTVRADFFREAGALAQALQKMGK